MKIVIEFHRTRDADDAHAIVGRESVEAADLDNAIGIARQLLRTLEMPQRPDSVTITDEKGATLYSGILECPGNGRRKAAIVNVCNDTERLRNVRAIGIWENEGGAPGRDCLDEQYARRIEADRCWTVYHVFTGVPAQVDGQTTTGLSRLEATDRMFSLNRRGNDGRHTTRARSTLSKIEDSLS
ncbi:hypothetical protein [Mesorhizobium xinjiangense]|uniref:hypothetical protein n=1 Tax=Mesorhizobium xinjiangense TaxID=2678685 RepID=UPI002E2545FA